MLKFLFVFDPHLSDKAPSTRKDNYQEAILKKLEFSVDTAELNKVSAILIAGDIFHKKIPAFTSHYLINRVIEILSKNKIPKFAVAGNHDILGNLSKLDKQPISVLETSGVLTLLDGTNPQLFTDLSGDKKEEEQLRVSISGLPWLNDRDKKESSNLYNMSHIEGVDFRIGLFHQMILPNNQTFFDNYINFSDLNGINSDLVAVGHYHNGFSPSLIEDNGKYFLNGGSLSRGSSEAFNFTKVPKIVIVSIDKVFNSVINEYEVVINFEDIPVPYVKAEEVFDLEVIKKKKDKKEMREFVENLSDFEVDSLSSSTPEGIKNILRIQGADENLLSIAEKYLLQVYESSN